MRLDAPFNEEKARSLRVGDLVEINGLLYTGRDSVHKYLHEGNEPPVDLSNSIIYHCGPVVVKANDEWVVKAAIYHCGPVVVKANDEWVVKAAGPTTSIREEPYQHEIIRKFHLRGVIGKGGMGPRTLEACREVGCVYLHAVGGAAQVLAARIIGVRGVHLMEFGSPEAIWELEVRDFPVVVTMDSHGNSLHRDLSEASGARLREILAAVDDRA
jgi:fumarate hydratase subunit beta